MFTLTAIGRRVCLLFGCILVLFLSSTVAVFAGDHNTFEQEKADDRPGLKYWLYIPVDYDVADRSRKWPLMLFLHGGGEGGKDMVDVLKHGPPNMIEAGEAFPMLVVSPRNPSQTQFWDDQQLIRLLDEIESRYHVDSDRVYLTGLSRGAFGAWRLAIQNPNRFAAMAPISGGGALPYVNRLQHVPIWVFHGAKDPVIPVSESMRLVDQLKQIGGDVRLTVYPDAEHDAWTEAYLTPELFHWMLKQKRKSQ